MSLFDHLVCESEQVWWDGYSISSSAGDGNDAGIVKPSALPVHKRVNYEIAFPGDLSVIIAQR